MLLDLEKEYLWGRQINSPTGSTIACTSLLHPTHSPLPCPTSCLPGPSTVTPIPCSLAFSTSFPSTPPAATPTQRFCPSPAFPPCPCSCTHTPQIPSTVTQGRELPLNQLSELLRQEVALAGYTEILTWALCSRTENFDNMRNPEAAPGSGAVAVGNPQTAEFEVCAPLGAVRGNSVGSS